MSLAINGTTIYFTDRDHGTVSSLPTAGAATPAMIASEQAMPTVIVADDHGVYWANQGDNTLMKAPLPTGAAAPLIPAFAAAPVSGLALHAGTLFFSNGNNVSKVDTTAATPAPVLVGTSEGKPKALALSDTAVFWPADLLAAVERHAQDGTGMTDPLAESQGTLLVDAIAVAGGRVLWGASISLVSKPVTADRGTAPVTIGTANCDLVTGLAATDTTVYLGEDGTIEQAPIGGGTLVATVIADGQHQPGSLLVDATSVYWRTQANGACAVLKLAR